MNFTETLNLPHTQFPMKANLPVMELIILDYWKTKKIYRNITQKNFFFTKFILIDGPPYANGRIHLGHGLNKILKDIILKTKNFFHFCINFIPGWDCHGLPIELGVEKILGKPKTPEEIEIFRFYCRKYAKEQLEIQKNEFIRLGILADWENYYSTMDFSFEANIIKFFNLIFFNKHIQQHKHPIYWCVDCRSALAEAEVIYKEIHSLAIFVFFQFFLESNFFIYKELFSYVNYEIFFIVWTTLPWTLIFNKAVAFNQSVKYVFLLMTSKKIFVVAEDVLTKFLDVCKKTSYFFVKNLGSFPGSYFKSHYIYDPIYHNKVPLLHSEHVTVTSGTGLVHIAPSFGYDDFLLSLKYHLSLDNAVIDESGFYSGPDLRFAYQKFMELTHTVIKILQETLKIMYCENFLHKYPHCWRHKSQLIFRSTSQWFVSMIKNNLYKKTLISGSKILFLKTAWGNKTFKAILEKRPDWCISRQRFWGVPLPMYLNIKTHKIHSRFSKIILKICKFISLFGVECWFKINKNIFLSYINISKKNIINYTFLSDVLDVWFDSSAVFFHLLKTRKSFINTTADLCVEGVDQFRGWFQSSLIATTAALCVFKKDLKNFILPFKTILCHGFVVDKDGKKLSKSGNNLISPTHIVNYYGADIFRLWVASVNFTNDIFFSTEIIERICDSYKKIRNTLRFLISNSDQNFFNKKNKISLNFLIKIDLWMIQYCFVFQKKCLNFFKKYEFNLVYQYLHYFCTNILSNYYFLILKDRLYTSSKQSLAYKSGKFTLRIIFKIFIHLIAPILSFTAEECWQYVNKNKKMNKIKSIFFSQWPENFLYKYYIKNERFDFFRKWLFFYEFRIFTLKIIEYFIRIKKINTISQAVLFILCKNMKILKKFTKVKNELQYLLGVSKVFILDDIKNVQYFKLNKFFIFVKKSDSLRCSRCWSFSVSSLFFLSNAFILCNHCILHMQNTKVVCERRFFF